MDAEFTRVEFNWYGSEHRDIYRQLFVIHAIRNKTMQMECNFFFIQSKLNFLLADG